MTLRHKKWHDYPFALFCCSLTFHTHSAFGITHQISRYRTNRCYGNCRQERSSGNILGGVSEWECSIYILPRPVITGQHRPVIIDELPNKGTINCRGQWPSPKQEITIMHLADAFKRLIGPYEIVFFPKFQMHFFWIFFHLNFSRLCFNG